MDLVQKEHERLQRRLKSSHGLKNVQSTIDQLQAARDAIASGQSSGMNYLSSVCSVSDFFCMVDPTQAAVTLAKLQNPVKTSFSSINDNLKETHSGLNKYTKSLDKVKLPPTPSGALH